MKAKEARRITEKAAAGDHTNMVLKIIKETAEHGFHAVVVEAGIMNAKTLSSLRKLGYHFCRHSRYPFTGILETDDYMVSW